MKIEIDEPIRTVLVLEDEAILAMMIEDLLREMGVSTIHSFASAAEAVDVARHGDIDFAVLDVQLRDGSSDEIASILADRGIPFAFTTGSDTSALADRHRNRPFLAKPFSDDQFKLLLLDTHMLAARKMASASATLN